MPSTRSSTRSSTAHRLVPGGAVDPEDGDPIWDFSAGEEVLPGVLVADSLSVGYRCETWLVWLRAGWHPAVLKLPRPHQLDHPRARASLQRELAGPPAGAGHPTSPRLVADHTGDDAPYLVMEYLDGPGLDEVLEEQGALDVTDAALLGAALLPALRVLHENGLAHV